MHINRSKICNDPKLASLNPVIISQCVELLCSFQSRNIEKEPDQQTLQTFKLKKKKTKNEKEKQ